MVFAKPCAGICKLSSCPVCRRQDCLCTAGQIVRSATGTVVAGGVALRGRFIGCRFTEWIRQLRRVEIEHGAPMLRFRDAVPDPLETPPSEAAGPEKGLSPSAQLPPDLAAGVVQQVDRRCHARSGARIVRSVTGHPIVREGPIVVARSRRSLAFRPDKVWRHESRATRQHAARDIQRQPGRCGPMQRGRH